MEINRAAVVAMNAKVRRTKARLMDEVPKLQKLAQKRVSLFLLSLLFILGVLFAIWNFYMFIAPWICLSFVLSSVKCIDDIFHLFLLYIRVFGDLAQFG